MRRIDAHQHFWRFDPVKDSWINDEMKLLQRDFLPGDLRPELQSTGIDGTIAVQADQSQAENDFLLKLADEHDFIQGVVGWVDLQADDLAAKLEDLGRHKKLKGFRHILQGEIDERFMLRPAFQRGIGLLHKYGYSYDILIFPRHLKHAAQLVAAFPDQRFVIDHLAKPYIKTGDIWAWRKDMEALASYENVWCKVSGMVTEASWHSWTKADLAPYLDVVFNAFGTKRILFGSDWPVCLLAASYHDVIDIVESYLAPFSADEKSDCLGGNATAFYQLT